MGSALALGGQTLKNRVIQALDRPGQPPVPTSIFEYAGGDGAISAVKARFK